MKTLINTNFIQTLSEPKTQNLCVTEIGSLYKEFIKQLIDLCDTIFDYKALFREISLAIVQLKLRSSEITLAGMNYMTEIKLFSDWLETHPLSPASIALWHALMFIANRSGWREELGISATLLEMRTNMPPHNHIPSA